MKNTGSFACAPAVSKSRTGFVPAPSRARTRFFPSASPRRAPVFPGGEKARTCGEQFAHRVCVFAQPRTHAAGSGCGPTPGFCFPGRGESPRLRRAHLRWASRAPCLFLPRVSHARGWFRVRAHTGLLFSRAGRKPTSCSLRPGKSPRLRRASRAAAPGKSRSVSLSSPCLARTRLVPGACPHRASVFPGGQESCLLFPAVGRKPAGQKPAPNFHK